MHKHGLCCRAVPVRLSVCHVRILCQNEKSYPQTFFTDWFAHCDSFLYQTLWQYSDGDSVMGAKIVIFNIELAYCT